MEYNQLQSDLHKFKKWYEGWLIPPTQINKCTVLYIGVSNPRLHYYIGVIALAAVHGSEPFIVKKTNSVYYSLRKSFHTPNRQLFLHLYKSHVRTVLEYNFELPGCVGMQKCFLIGNMFLLRTAIFVKQDRIIFSWFECVYKFLLGISILERLELRHVC